MRGTTLLAVISISLHVLIQLAVAIRVILRPHRDPASRIAWLAVLFTLPVLGILAYVLFGETNIGRSRARRRHDLVQEIFQWPEAAAGDSASRRPLVPDRHTHLFRLGQSISGFAPTGGNSGTLLASSDATIDAMVADIEAAEEHVHLLFYIWLPDNNGSRIAESLKRAAGRGVVCRALADDLGSRLMIRSPLWQSMAEAGVRLGRALPIGNPLLRAFKGRIDLRNHRKIVVIDDRITYCGSQNCADPEFRIKARYAPWVDAMIRFEGPIARQNQFLFAIDWMTSVDDDLGGLLRRPLPGALSGFPAQVIGTGPTMRYSGMPEMFESLIYSARRELVITTPYYVPDDPMQAALCASARRGVATTIVLPARNDSWVVAAASRSYYGDLLAAGVRIHEYVGGLLHTKSLTLDDEVTLIGSANMDRRSFDLNYENNVLFYDPALTAEVRKRQESYIAKSVPVDQEFIEGWSWRRRLWNNTIAMLGPIL